MEFLRYKGARGRYRLGVRTPEGLYDLAACYSRYREMGLRAIPGIAVAFAQGSLRTLLARPGVGDFLAAVRLSGAHCRSAALREDPVALGAPLHDPGRFIGIGLNYRCHAREVGQSIPVEPPLFAKWANAISGPQDEIMLPMNSQAIDYEVELGVVMGQRASRVSVNDALDYVFGYTVINDVSARDLQFRTSQWLAGKIGDGFAPMGPGVVERDDIGPSQGLTLETWVNGELRQHGHTSDMIYDVPALVSYLSHLVTLEPGDVIATGTPAGVGMSRKPPRYLHPGDIVRMRIAGVGTIENRFCAPR